MLPGEGGRSPDIAAHVEHDCFFHFETEREVVAGFGSGAVRCSEPGEQSWSRDGGPIPWIDSTTVGLTLRSGVHHTPEPTGSAFTFRS